MFTSPPPAPIYKFPYAGGHAQPSKNESAVSSEASNQQQARATAAAAVGTFARSTPPPLSAPQQSSLPYRRLRGGEVRLIASEWRLRKLFWKKMQRADANAFRHDNADGRREFASALSRRLDDLVAKISRSERLNEQLKRIGRRTAHSTREVVCATEISISSYGHGDEDEDISNYVKSRWAADDSTKASPRQRSPNVGLVATATATAIVAPSLERSRRRSPSKRVHKLAIVASASVQFVESCSPDVQCGGGGGIVSAGVMSHSYYDQFAWQPARMPPLHAPPPPSLPLPLYAPLLHAAAPVSAMASGGQTLRTHSDYDDSSGIGSMATTSSFAMRAAAAVSHAAAKPIASSAAAATALTNRQAARARAQPNFASLS